MKSSVFGLVAVFALLAGPGAWGQSVEGWHVEFEAGQARARASGKDLLIDFGGSDWCAACQWLKTRVLDKPEFIQEAGRSFALIDIDLPGHSPIPPDRKARYEELQARYGVVSFPTIILADAEGRAYARETYREAYQTPESYWKFLQTRVDRGRRLREALARAEKATGRAKLEALVEGLSEVDPRFLPRFFATFTDEVRALGPTDPTGYLAFLNGRKAVDDFTAKLDPHQGAIDPNEVDALIARAALRGEALQDALILRAAGEVLAGDDLRAIRTLAMVLDAQTTRTRFDRGDFVPLDNSSIATVRRRLLDAEADPGDGVARSYALLRIFSFDMPNPYDWSCGSVFQPGIRVRDPLGDRYGRALIASTRSLEGEARARALARGLDGTFLAARGSIKEIVMELIPRLVGKEQTRLLVPGPYYPRWID